VGSITDENARVLSVDLKFLAPGKTYTARIYADAPDADFRTNPTAYEIREQEVTRGHVLTMELAPGGGQAIALIPKD
jgi:alpha-glucosidase